MTDRELLERAAKAAGIEIHPHPNRRVSSSLAFVANGNNWNPLTDDGDALRLAVKLGRERGLSVQWNAAFLRTEVVSNDAPDVAEQWDGDPDAATRRAIVRAAAALGEGME